jgi:hypothetical protein
LLHTCMTGRFSTGASRRERRNWLANDCRTVSAALPLAGRGTISTSQLSRSSGDVPVVLSVHSIGRAPKSAFVVGASAPRMNPIRPTLDAPNARHRPARPRPHHPSLPRYGTRGQRNSVPFAACFAAPSLPEQDSASTASPIERVFQPIDSPCHIKYNRADLSQRIERLAGG